MNNECKEISEKYYLGRSVWAMVKEFFSGIIPKKGCEGRSGTYQGCKERKKLFFLNRQIAYVKRSL